ncbi:unnamed protein product [Pleuronectes platessa]|uniref:Uncharacterized protein n=1 Tax=Pleuronectes platessa TaxID=8262 RepID=A0A9N7ZEP8_PLEPL|nr:unnamed protein product [Pleuronectes platessa]
MSNISQRSGITTSSSSSSTTLSVLHRDEGRSFEPLVSDELQEVKPLNTGQAGLRLLCRRKRENVERSDPDIVPVFLFTQVAGGSAVTISSFAGICLSFEPRRPRTSLQPGGRYCLAAAAGEDSTQQQIRKNKSSASSTTICSVSYKRKRSQKPAGNVEEWMSDTSPPPLQHFTYNNAEKSAEK